MGHVLLNVEADPDILNPVSLAFFRFRYRVGIPSDKLNVIFEDSAQAGCFNHAHNEDHVQSAILWAFHVTSCATRCRSSICTTAVFQIQLGQPPVDPERPQMFERIEGENR